MQLSLRFPEPSTRDESAAEPKARIKHRPASSNSHQPGHTSLNTSHSPVAILYTRNVVRADALICVKMASSVFFKFMSQKEPTRVEFDGTGISVFELKGEIIRKSNLGDGTTFDLSIFTDDTKEGKDPSVSPNAPI